MNNSAGPPDRNTKSLTAVISNRAETGSATRLSSPARSNPAMNSRKSRYFIFIYNKNAAR
jgi:hypothetical protein